MRKKTEIKIKPFWYSDIWIFPKLITIITTLDKEGKVNAAPYSHIMQYDVMHKTPRMMVGFRKESHTFQNICDTGEFVVNCPPADYLDDMMETARFWPAGVNELEHSRFTPIPSIKVKPPSKEMVRLRYHEYLNKRHVVGFAMLSRRDSLMLILSVSVSSRRSCWFHMF